MRTFRFRALLVFLVLLLPVQYVAAGPATSGSAVDAVRQLERRWLDAYEKPDPRVMDLILGEGFTITFPNGAVQTRAQLMDWITKAQASAGPRPRFHTEDVQARAYGDTVILMGRVLTERTRDGRIEVEESRYTDTYLKRHGRWQVVASHLSNSQEAKPQK